MKILGFPKLVLPQDMAEKNIFSKNIVYRFGSDCNYNKHSVIQLKSKKIRFSKLRVTPGHGLKQKGV